MNRSAVKSAQRQKKAKQATKSASARTITTRTRTSGPKKALKGKNSTAFSTTMTPCIPTTSPQTKSISYLVPQSISSLTTTAATTPTQQRRRFSSKKTHNGVSDAQTGLIPQTSASKFRTKPLATHFISLSPMSMIPKLAMKRSNQIISTFGRLFSTQKDDDEKEKEAKKAEDAKKSSNTSPDNNDPKPSSSSADASENKGPDSNGSTEKSDDKNNEKSAKDALDEENRKKRKETEEQSKWSSIPKFDSTKFRSPSVDPETSMLTGLRVMVALILLGQMSWVGAKLQYLAGDPTSYQDILTNYISQRKISNVTLFSKRAMFKTTDNQEIFHDVLSVPDFAAKLAMDTQRFNLSIPVDVVSIPESGIPFILLVILLQVAGMPSLLSKTKNMFSDRSGPKITKVKNLSTRFSDVAGMDEAKNEIVEFVDFLKEPEKFQKLGARLPKGALLSGPPGTGKTLLAKATAGEAGVSFYTVSGSEFQQMYVGQGAKKVRDLFKTARKNAPAIIFIDEIDSIAKQRSARGNDSSSEREATLNQLLVEMDGFDTKEAVVVFAATNRAETLDEAVTRAGRFDRKIAVSAPDLKGREEVFNVHLSKLQLAHPQAEVAKKISALTPGMVGADIANVCNEAAIGAARRENKLVELVDFETAVDKVVGGLEKKSDMQNHKQREIVAYHEAGHALMGWFLEHTDPLLKVTIVPRTNGALGFAQYLPKENGLSQTDQMHDMVAMALGGRAAEDLVYGKVSTGASDDLKQVANIVQTMILRYGMSTKFYNTAFATLDSDGAPWKHISQKTHFEIDQEIAEVVDKQYNRAKSLLSDKRNLLDALGKALLEKETLNHEEIVAVLGPRPFQSDHYVDYVKSRQEFDKDLQKEKKSHEGEAEVKKEEVKH